MVAIDQYIELSKADDDKEPNNTTNQLHTCAYCACEVYPHLLWNRSTRRKSNTNKIKIRTYFKNSQEVPCIINTRYLCDKCFKLWDDYGYYDFYNIMKGLDMLRQQHQQKEEKEL